MIHSEAGTECERQFVPSQSQVKGGVDLILRVGWSVHFRGGV